MLERQIERRLCDEVKSAGGVCLKQTGLAGIPDRLVVMPGGMCAFIELKAPGEKPRKLQMVRMKQLSKLGFKCYVIDGIEQIKPVIDSLRGGDAK